jgi:hypothetical protein
VIEELVSSLTSTGARHATLPLTEDNFVFSSTKQEHSPKGRF